MYVAYYSNIVDGVIRFRVWETEFPSPEFPRHFASDYPAAQILRRMETR